jgi:hypothetical protein
MRSGRSTLQPAEPRHGAGAGGADQEEPVGADQLVLVGARKSDDGAQDPVRSVERVGEADTHGGEARVRQAIRQLAWAKDADVPTR